MRIVGRVWLDIGLMVGRVDAFVNVQRDD